MHFLGILKMNDLSLYLLDIVQNSLSAKADIIEIHLIEDSTTNQLTMIVKDNGQGMSKETIAQVIDPFFTTRTTRKVGLGIPFLKMASDLALGDLTIDSSIDSGTTIKAWFQLEHSNTPPLGDITETLFILMIHDSLKDLKYVHQFNTNRFEFCSGTFKAILDGVPFTEPTVMTYIKSYLNENINNLRRTL